MCFLRGEKLTRMCEFASDNERAPARLRHAVVGCAQFRKCHLETEGMRNLRNFLVFLRTEKLRNVFHHEHFRTSAFYNAKIRPPKLLPGITFSLFVQEAKPLTWRTADHNVCFGYFVNSVLDNFQNIVRGAVIPEVNVVSSGGVGVEIVGPHRHEDLA